MIRRPPPTSRAEVDARQARRDWWLGVAIVVALATTIGIGLGVGYALAYRHGQHTRHAQRACVRAGGQWWADRGRCALLFNP